MILLVKAILVAAALLLRVGAYKRDAAAASLAAVDLSITLDLHDGGFTPESIEDETQAADSDPTNDQGLLAWAATQRSTHPDAKGNPSVITVPMSTQLLIGVKSAVLDGFSSRQLIRQTWADRNRLPLGAHIVFLGCEPNVTAFDKHQQSQLLRALQVEKATYGDFLTHELSCQDSYFNLVQKVKGFLLWTSDAMLPALKYVMLADDDVYIRVDKLLPALVDHSSIPRQGFYAGQVFATEFGRLLPVGRNPSDKNAVPVHEYGMQYTPPFASGPHYLLSIDLVHFLAHNHAYLKGVGTLEDVSVAFWLLVLRQIRPLHIREFENVRFRLCHNSLFTYADLKKEAIHRMHANLLENRSLCDGFSFRLADKRVSKIIFPTMDLTDRQRALRPLNHNFDLHYNVSAHTLQFQITISTVSGSESASVVFEPTQHNVAVLCVSLYVTIAEKMPTAALPVDFCEEIRAQLQRLLLEAEREAPASGHVFALARSNLHHGVSSAAVQVLLLTRVVRLRLVFESLLATAFPDAHVEILREDDVTITPPDIVVAGVDDLQAAGTTFTMPELSRLIVVSNEASIPAAVMNRLEKVPILLVASTAETPECPDGYLYLPIASWSFADRRNHSPRALLRPVVAVSGFQERGSVAFFASSATSTAEAIFTTALKHHEVLTAEEVDEIQSTTTTTAFTLDADVDRCHQYKFAVAFEDHPDAPGYIGHHIVSAFLAGSIPIYYGHSPTVSWLFNPNAFIDCRIFDSMSDCAAHVARVHASANLYEAMRREPPVVNHTAFREVFSWHPDAMTDYEHEEQTMAKRFHEKLMNI